jgi:hypothetical protein
MKLTIICFLLTTLSCCSSNRISTVWKTGSRYKTEFRQVLVVAILPEEDSILRKQIENDATINLKYLGYPAISALEHFGAKGLADMGEEATYIKLCNSGIDFVLTIAFIYKTKEKPYGSDGSMLYPGSYYYDRIWGYKNKLSDENNNSTECFYESVLFNLATLQAQSVFRTHQFDESEKIKISNELLTRLVKKMMKEIVLTPHITPAALKPF